MFDHEEVPATPTSQVVTHDIPAVPENRPEVLVPPQDTGSGSNAAPTEKPVNDTAAASDDWHADAGRKGALRVQQLIELGRQYEKEHGLKRGRQRIRQLIELGKLYETEHGVRPRRPGKRGDRLGRGQRKELLNTLVRCLVRIAKPSFRNELNRLAKELHHGEEGQAA
jgi:hypothetical protein